MKVMAPTVGPTTNGRVLRVQVEVSTRSENSTLHAVMIRAGLNMEGLMEIIVIIATTVATKVGIKTRSGNIGSLTTLTNHPRATMVVGQTKLLTITTTSLAATLIKETNGETTKIRVVLSISTLIIDKSSSQTSIIFRRARSSMTSKRKIHIMILTSSRVLRRCKMARDSMDSTRRKEFLRFLRARIQMYTQTRHLLTSLKPENTAMRKKQRLLISKRRNSLNPKTPTVSRPSKHKGLVLSCKASKRTQTTIITIKS